MEVTITIECESFEELLMHLSKIRSQIKKEQDAIEGDEPTTIELSDSNCYGSHEIEITTL
jgi:hypothetical protein